MIVDAEEKGLINPETVSHLLPPDRRGPGGYGVRGQAVLHVQYCTLQYSRLITRSLGPKRARCLPAAPPSKRPRTDRPLGRPPPS